MSGEDPNREWEKQKLSATFFNIVAAGLTLGGLAQILIERDGFLSGVAAIMLGGVLHRVGRANLGGKE